MSELNTESKKIGFSTSVISWVSAVGFIILLLPVSDSSLYGYSTIFFSLMGMMMIHLALVTKENMESGIIKILISMNIVYYNRFNNPEMLPDEFTNFKSLVTGLLGISIILVTTITSQEQSELQAKNKGQNNISKFYKFASESGSSMLYLLITILGISVGLMQVIMKYYITDG